ncbi:MAG: Lrp/AsnC family transcriptional regulator GigD [Acinetobacter sp.]
MNLDVIDFKILRLLQENARLSHQELADLVSLSASACHRRVKILESSGVIEKYQAKINYEKLGIQVEAIVEIKLNQLTEIDHQHFLSKISDFEEVVNVFIITGDSNYVLFVATKDLNSFSQFIINKLNKIKGIANINSKIILEKVIQKQIIG